MLDRDLSGATTPGQSRPGSNGNEGVLRIPQGPSVTRTSSSDCLVSYPGLSFWGSLIPQQRCSQCILQPQPTGQELIWTVSILSRISNFLSLLFSFLVLGWNVPPTNSVSFTFQFYNFFQLSGKMQVLVHMNLFVFFPLRDLLEWQSLSVNTVSLNSKVPPSKKRMYRGLVKVCWLFFLVDFLPGRKTINSEAYRATLIRLRARTRRVRPNLIIDN